VKALLINCYELGRQPFNLASPWAQLTLAGFEVEGVDTALDELPRLIDAALVAVSVPMLTALRLGVEVAAQVRKLAPDAHLCFYGLYAALNAAHLLDSVADSVIGGEFEQALVDLAQHIDEHGAVTGDATIDGVVTRRAQLDGGRTAPPVLRKLPFVEPHRDGLAALSRYATFYGPLPGEVRQVGYVEASRGCKHRCLHCPVTPVYQGRFFVVPESIVWADAEQQIARGAQHITFGDPDFFNGPKHGMRIVRELHRRHPKLSFDVTIKVEHIVAEPELVLELGTLGCAFIVSAVESLSDEVLRRLDKGHSRADIDAALAICRDGAVALRPSLVAFTPWTTLDDYVELVTWILREGLVDHVDPIQLAIRLLVPPGSALLWQTPKPDWLGPLDAANFGYRWTHPDPRMDELFKEVTALVERGAADAAETLYAIHEAACRIAGVPATPPTPPARSFVPHLSEAWFCCAEPNPAQLEHLRAPDIESKTTTG
jgi:radical SAM superfamily enzyme YgiQ (UPF0313 family)